MADDPLISSSIEAPSIAVMASNVTRSEPSVSIEVNVPRTSTKSAQIDTNLQETMNSIPIGSVVTNLGGSSSHVPSMMQIPSQNHGFVPMMSQVSEMAMPVQDSSNGVVNSQFLGLSPMASQIYGLQSTFSSVSDFDFYEKQRGLSVNDKKVL
ncbi:hypothetical protein Sjap_015983 [Stephania japonica]|uniref:Uncharacterized protein n=1 Tax=Stephania japonica TaxID=461633 RepID=A0AAP0IK49_9MAGN